MRVPPVDQDEPGPLPTPPHGARWPGSLVGAWSATRWEYRGAAGAAVDLVTELGGVVTASFGADAWVISFTIPGRGMRSSGGTFAALGGQLELRAVPDAEPVVLRYRVSGDTLTWSDEQSAWDFDGDGVEEAASLVAVFVRI